MGIDGLALLRGFITGSDEEAAERVEDGRRIAASPDDEPPAAATGFPERLVGAGTRGNRSAPSPRPA